MNELILNVYKFAVEAHGDQKRKYSGEPYIAHCQRVMQECWVYTDDDTILAAVLLHDVLEDTPVDKEELHQFLKSVMYEEDAAKTLQLVVDLTDIYIKEDYPQLNRRARKKKEAARMKDIHPDAQMVKYADIIDNAVDITENDVGFARKYLHEVKDILSGMNEGHPQLYHKALATVEQCLRKV